MKQFLIGLLMVFTSMTGFAQITGTVVDAETNEPLPGATVVIKGTQNGTTTDFDGLFSISGASIGDTLVITYIGFEPGDWRHDQVTQGWGVCSKRTHSVVIIGRVPC